VVDSLAPSLTVSVSPLPRPGPLSGTNYVEEVIIKGNYSDTNGPAAIRPLRIEVKNSSGDHVNDSPITVSITTDRGFSELVRLVEGINNITVRIEDLAGNVSIVSFTLVFTPPETTAVIGAGGGTVRSPDGTEIIIPAGALINDETIGISIADNVPPPVDPIEQVFIGVAYNLEPNDLVFQELVTLIISYTEADLDPDQDGIPDYAETNLVLFYLENGQWVNAGEVTVDPVNNTLSVNVNHLGIYRIGIDNRATAAVVEGYWTGNPFRADQGTSLVLSLPGAGSLTLKIYDLAGDLVRTVTENQNVGATGWISLRWDGKNDFGEYVGSGIYIYVLKFNDKVEIKKTLGVIK